MNIRQTNLDGVLVLEPKKFHDSRGYFLELFRESNFQELGVSESWVQDNCSYSKKAVLRGLHFQNPQPQGKLVQAMAGSIFDVAVDLREGSKTFGSWFGEELNEENRHQLWIPEGFAHGFVVLSDSALVTYKVTAYYHAAGDAGIAWNDPDIDIRWPITDCVLSEKDQGLPFLRDLDPSKLF